MNTTWRKIITDELKSRNETWLDVLACTLKSHELDIEFDHGFGGCSGKPFTLWTRHYVYFPTQYDGAEGVASAPRNISDEPTHHAGGGGSEWNEGYDEEERAEKRAKGWEPLPEKYRRAW